MSSHIDAIQMSDGEYFPVFKNLWDFFAAKGNKVIFLSVGPTKSPVVELHFSEALGCKLHIFSQDAEYLEKWNEIKDILKSRRADEKTSFFAKQSLKKWVLPHNIITSTESLTFASTKKIVSSICANVNEERIDVLKVDGDTQTIASTLYSVLHYGYRPGLLLIHWETTPDSTLETTILAGHIQNNGYGLVSKSGNNYLYMFTDKNIYEMCSWESTDAPNPLLAKLLDSFSVKNERSE